MAGNYQNVSTPRFWVSTLQWLDSLNLLTTSFTELGYFTGKKITYINPTSSAIFNYTGDLGKWTMTWEIDNVAWEHVMPTNKNFFMCLGHNLRWHPPEGGGTMHYLESSDTSTQFGKTPYVNYRGDTTGFPYRSEWDGFSIGIDDNAGALNESKLNFVLEGYYKGEDFIYHIGSVLYGTYFDLQAPDLNLSMKREYGEVKTSQSKNGSYYSNSFTTKQPNWGNNLPAWALIGGDGTEPFSPLAMGGRRTWDLKFSYLDEQDVFPKMTSLTDYQTGTEANLEYLKDTLLQENTFYSQVLLRTQGLPFVFQPDSNNKNPDQFAICMFDQDSFQFKRTSLSTYDVSLKIREVW